MLKKSKITGKFYTVESLTLEDKMRLGFDNEVVEDLKKVDEEEKKSRVRKRKDEDD